MMFAVYFKYLKNFDEVYDDGADPIIDYSELKYTCECVDEMEVKAFSYYLPKNRRKAVFEIREVSSQAEKHFDRDSVKSQLMSTYIIRTTFMSKGRARYLCKFDLVGAALAED